MKRPILFFVLVILLAGGAIGAMSGPSYAQGYGGYNYPPPPQNIYATPWVGNNTPWVFYKGDWFLNGILYNFFGNRYGWAPYYAYPPVYIVRPNNWYAPSWNAWYQGHPHYWNNFQRQYPYWREHHAGQHYDQNFYNRYHRGQGSGWNQGFHGVRPPGTNRPAIRPPGAAGPGFHGTGTTGPAVRPSGVTGPTVRPPGAPGPGFPGPGTTGPGVRPSGVTGPTVRPPGAAGPGFQGPGTTGPTVRPPGVTGPTVRPPGTPAPGGSPKATAPRGGKPGTTTPREETRQQ
jgi:hypothetical protein